MKKRKRKRKNLEILKTISDNKQLYRLLRFLVRLNIFAIPSYFIIFSGLTWPAFMQFTQHLSFAILNFIGVAATLNDGFIIVPIINGNFAATVSWDSTGWKSILALFALIFATEFPLRKKMIGLLFIPIMYLVNIFRIVFMFVYVTIYDIAYYDLLHTVIWSWGLIGVVLLLWFIWMKYV